MIDLLDILLIVMAIFFFLVMLYFLWPDKPTVRQDHFAKNRFGGAAEYTDTTRTSVHKKANRNEL